VDPHAIEIAYQFHHHEPWKVPSSPCLIDWTHSAILHATEVHLPIVDYDENAIQAHYQFKINLMSLYFMPLSLNIKA
jgi:hypothetical protein